MSSQIKRQDVDFIWKVLVSGEGAVGKSCILHRYIHNEFVSDMKMTIGCQFHTQLLQRQGFRINLVLWDFSGQSRFRFLFDDYCRGAAGAFIMFDMSRLDTLYQLPKWITLIKNNSKGSIPIALIGGKLDLIPREKLDELNALADGFAKEHGCSAYIPTSSLINFNVNESIMYMVDLLIAQNA
nr:Rab family GTPase [Candidatus Sigynarchaeota archaeon]